MTSHPLPPLDAALLTRTTGWRVVAFEEVASTNDEAARLRDEGTVAPTVVVADRQRRGRGRGGHTFASPDGGLYASLLLRVRREHLPAALVAAVSVALAEAVEEAGAGPVHVKWPNDLWIHGRKVAGVLLEASLPSEAGRESVPVIVGVGVNLRAVPDDLDPAVRAATSALDLHAPAPVDRAALLGGCLRRLRERLGTLDAPRGRETLEAAYRRRLALLGEPIRCFVGTEAREGVLRDASLTSGLLVEGADGERRWLPPEHVREVRRAPGAPP